MKKYATREGWARQIVSSCRVVSARGGFESIEEMHLAGGKPYAPLNLSPEELLERALLWDRCCQGGCGRSGLTFVWDGERHSRANTAHTDHSHIDGRFRGFVCGPCNIKDALSSPGEREMREEQRMRRKRVREMEKRVERALAVRKLVDLICESPSSFEPGLSE